MWNFINPWAETSPTGRLPAQTMVNLFVESAGEVYPAALRCPISHCLLSNPVRTVLGQTYEYESISEWLRRSDLDPMTNERLPSKILVPDFSGRIAYDEFKANVLAAHPEAAKWFTCDHVANRGAVDTLLRDDTQARAPTPMAMAARQEPPRPSTSARRDMGCSDGLTWLATRLGGYLTGLVLCPLGCACAPLLGLNIHTRCYRQRCDSIPCVLIGVACGACCDANVNIDAKWNFAVGPFND